MRSIRTIWLNYPVTEQVRPTFKLRQNMTNLPSPVTFTISTKPSFWSLHVFVWPACRAFVFLLKPYFLRRSRCRRRSSFLNSLMLNCWLYLNIAHVNKFSPFHLSLLLSTLYKLPPLVITWYSVALESISVLALSIPRVNTFPSLPSSRVIVILASSNRKCRTVGSATDWSKKTHDIT